MCYSLLFSFLFPCPRAKDFLIKTSSVIDFLIMKLLVWHFRKKSCNTNTAFLTVFFQGKVSLREESFLNFSPNRQEFYETAFNLCPQTFKFTFLIFAPVHCVHLSKEIYINPDSKTVIFHDLFHHMK